MDREIEYNYFQKLLFKQAVTLGIVYVSRGLT